VVEAIVANGLAQGPGPDGANPWGFSENIDYRQRFTLNVVHFLPVTGITDVPTLAFAGVPMQLRGTVVPSSASFRNIEWRLGSINTAGVSGADVERGIIVGQWPGTVSVVATIRNGLRSGEDFEQTFNIRVDPFISHNLDLRANPGGRVSGAGAGQFAGGQVVTITATPNSGFVFAGWHSSNGGELADSNHSTTEFTMPGNATTVTAFFTFTGLPAGNITGEGGGVTLPIPVHYFTHSSVYVRNSGVSFGHVTVRDFTLFNHVTLNGARLSRGSQFFAARSGGNTEITLTNGFLDTLSPGQHTLSVHFTDRVIVTLEFSVVAAQQSATTFQDVRASDWFFNSVVFVSNRGWMTSSAAEPSLFRPSAAVTQGDVVDALYRMAGSPTVLNQHGQSLQGRDAAHEWVRASGILPIGGQYNLGSAITRQDIAVLFDRLVVVLRLRYPTIRGEPTFADEWLIDPGARRPVVSLFRAGILNGRTASTFVPLGNMTRAEFAAVLHRFADAVGNW